MSPEEKRAKDAARKREAYRRRKEAQAELSNKLPDKSPQEEAALRLAQANGIDVPPPNSKEKAEAVMADAAAREEYVRMLFAKYEKTTNIPQLLAGILRELIETRIVLVDLIGGLRK